MTPNAPTSANRTGVRTPLGSRAFSDSEAAQVAGMVAEKTIEGGDAASAVAGAAASARAAQAAGAMVGVANELARQAPAGGCGAAAE